MGVDVEVKLEAFATSSKKRVRTSDVSASVTDALRFTCVSPVYPPLLIAVDASLLS